MSTLIPYLFFYFELIERDSNEETLSVSYYPRHTPLTEQQRMLALYILSLWYIVTMPKCQLLCSELHVIFTPVILSF